ncbi:hypothetical protein V8B97DRAFT_1180986 [Scleroderma yunnanense]
MSRPPSSYANSWRSFNTASRLTLRPTGTDAFPSILDSLEAWNEEVQDSNSYIDPQSHLVEPPASPALGASHHIEVAENESDVHAPSTLRAQSPLPIHIPQTKPSDGFIQRAKRFGGHIKQLVTRRKGNKRDDGLNGSFTFKNVARREGVGGPILIDSPVPLHSTVECRGSDEISWRLPANQPWSYHDSTSDSIPKHEGRIRKSLRRLSLAA